MKNLKSARFILVMGCEICRKNKSKMFNYTTEKNKKNTPNKLELNKYCNRCLKKTLYKELK
jgi:large subunit ribosomal protein L33